MYYCLNCNKLHEKNLSAEKLFQSGYVLVNECKVPLGMCTPEESYKKSRKIFFKKSVSTLQSVR
jgi:hypothetical protein